MTKNADEIETVTAPASYEVGDQVMVNSILGTLTSWPEVEDPDQWFTFEVVDASGSVTRRTEQLGTVTIQGVPKLGE